MLRINSTTRKLGFARNGQINNVANDLLVFGIGEGGTVSQQNQDYESAIIRLKGKYGNRILKNHFLNESAVPVCTKISFLEISEKG